MFKSEVRAEAQIETTVNLNHFLETVDRNLDVLIELIELYGTEADKSLMKLVSIENDLTLFTYKRCNLNQYKQNTIGDCVVTRVGNTVKGYCHINDLRKLVNSVYFMPEMGKLNALNKLAFIFAFYFRQQPQLSKFRRHNLKQFPQSGEVFAADLGEKGLFRVVRSDLIFKVCVVL